MKLQVCPPGRAWLPRILVLLAFAALTRLAAQSTTPFRISLQQDEEWAHQPLRENDEVRLQIIPTGGRTSDPAVEVRWRISARAHDGAGADLDSPPPTEGVEWVRPGDPARWITLKVPDDTEPSRDSERSLVLRVSSPADPAVLPAQEFWHPLLDNEYLFGDGVLETLGGPGLRLEESYFDRSWGMVSPNLFVPTADGGAYFVSYLSDPVGSTSSILRRIRPDLTLDPEYRAGTPDGSWVIAVAPVPAGGSIALVQREVGGEHLAEVVRLDGEGVRNAAYTANATVSLAGFSPHLLQATDEGGAYLADHRRIVLLTADGTVDRRFKEPGFIGDLASLVRQDENLYALGSFSQVEGLGTNRFGAFRIGASGGTDPGFAVILGTNQGAISQLVELGDGRIVTHGAPRLDLHSHSGTTLTNLFTWDFFSMPPVFVVRRFGSSARRTQLEVRITPMASAPSQDLPSFSIPLTFEPGETEKQVFLPDGSGMMPGSAAIFRTTLQPSPQGVIEGAATADCLVVGPSRDEARPELGVHRFGSGILDGEPIFRLTGRPGPYQVQYSVNGVTWKEVAYVELSSESPTLLLKNPIWVHDREPATVPGSEMLLLRAVHHP